MTFSKVVGFFSEKGGAGKSTATLLLALFLRYLGRKVVVLDTDPSGWASMLLAYKEYLDGRFYEDINPAHRQESILGLVEAFLSDDDVVGLFVKALRTSSLFAPDDPLAVRYIPPSKELSKYLSQDDKYNDAFHGVLVEVEGSLPDLLRDCILIVDTAPNDRLMQWAAFNIAGLPGGAFIPIGYSLMDIQGSAATVSALLRMETPILGLIPIGDRDRKTDQVELENLGNLYRVLPPIPDMASLSRNTWVPELRIPTRALPTLHAMCEILEIPSRTAALRRQAEESSNRGYLDVRIPMPAYSSRPAEK